ncbi:MAG: hypothetical protein E6K70_23235 [Planctomycetota bacterium]|nr:MAG: hypothetical protein E6K70_23235 [Planctomycetota bacterium]
MLWPLLDDMAVLLGIVAVLAMLLAFFAWSSRAIYKDLRANGLSWPRLSGVVLYLVSVSAIALMFFLVVLDVLKQLPLIQRLVPWAP